MGYKQEISCTPRRKEKILDLLISREDDLNILNFLQAAKFNGTEANIDVHDIEVKISFAQMNISWKKKIRHIQDALTNYPDYFPYLK